MAPSSLVTAKWDKEGESEREVTEGIESLVNCKPHATVIMKLLFLASCSIAPPVSGAAASEAACEKKIHKVYNSVDDRHLVRVYYAHRVREDMFTATDLFSPI